MAEWFGTKENLWFTVSRGNLRPGPLSEGSRRRGSKGPSVSESTDIPHRKKAGFARRLFRSVGQAAGRAAEGVLKTAGQTVKGAGDRVRLTFTGEVEETPHWELRAMAESLTQWLVEECRGTADLQQQKPSTVELSELGQIHSFFEIVMEEPGITGRRFRFIVRARPLAALESNFPTLEGQHFDAQLLLVRSWPPELTAEPKSVSCLVWAQAAAIGPRNSAQDLGQRWLSATLGGSFARKKVLPTKLKVAKASTPLLGRDKELTLAREILLTPSPSEGGLLALAAPGGTGKSYFLRALKQEVESRVIWAGVDHQCLGQVGDGVEFIAKTLSALAKGLESLNLSMSGFRKEYLRFQKSRGAEEAQGGIFNHVRKALESAAGINPVLGAASAGATFLASWNEEVKEQSEALARDDAVLALTRAFKDDLREWSERERSQVLLWRRPVLVFDTYEWLAPLVDVWLRTQLLADDLFAKSQTVVVLAGRDHPLKVDTRWAEFSSAMTVIELKPFPKSTALEFLKQLKAPEARFDELYELTGGLPLFLSLVAHISSVEEASEILGKRILEEVPRELWSDFRRASLLEHFTPTELAKLFSERSREELESLLRRLGDATFAESGEGRRAFTPAVGAILRRNLLVEVGPEAYQALQERLSR